MLMALIAGAICACQVTASTATLRVRNGDQSTQIAVTRHPDGGNAVRADQLAEALGATFVADGGTRYHLQLASYRVDVGVGSRFAIAGADTLPLPAAAFRTAGRVFLPFAFVSDALPQLAGGLVFDAPKGELRQFGKVVARKPAASSPAPAAQSAPARGEVPATRPASTRAGNRQPVVVVDAGHGGPDRGMTGPIGSSAKVYEKDITLAVAKQLREALERRGVRVVMTRTKDTLIALTDRGKIANEAKGDLFMSVHVNAANPRWSSPGSARGFETYFLAEAKTEDERRVAAMENESIKFETTVDASRDDPLGFIIRDMAQNEHLRESARLAELVQRGLAGMHPGPNRGVKQAGFRVLINSFMPAVLIEIGFGTNRAESIFMTDADKQRALAETMADAAAAFLAQYQRKVGSGT
ncbi:MAG: N-acetylmuramoyl-L-alanine amidase [Gemmatimonadota bacterium]